MRIKESKLYLPLVMIVLLTGCSANVTRDAGSEKTAVSLSDLKLKEVKVVLSSKAKGRLAKNLKFDQRKLVDYVKRALEANDLLNETSTSQLEIKVLDMRVRSNFSAVMFGFFAGADFISGDIIVKDSEQSVLDKFTVKVSYALGGLAGGMDGTRMDWLYESFANKVIEEMQGYVETEAVAQLPEN